MQDFKKIASEAIEQCKMYQARIQELEKQLSLKKQASAVDKDLLEKSVEALTKTGSIMRDQIQETKNLLASDPNASLRAITALCGLYTDAEPNMKKESSSIQGGTLVRQGLAKKASVQVDDAYKQVALCLGLDI